MALGVIKALAIGRVQQIVKSISLILEKMHSPYIYLKNATKNTISKDFKGFKHRFIDEDDLTFMLFGIKNVISRFGSIKECFKKSFKKDNSTIAPSLSNFVKELGSTVNERKYKLLPLPNSKSAFKRINLFLRWMIRQDRVDPGGWDSISPSKLIVPLDTHMFKIGQAFGFTMRKSNDLKTALEITNAFRKFCPEDPVKYDFALTRLGISQNNRQNISKELSVEEYYRKITKTQFVNFKT